MTRVDPHDFLRSRGICVWCHQYYVGCIAEPDDYGSHDAHWKANCVTSRRPWWSAKELMHIILRDDAILRRLPPESKETK